MKQNLIGGLTIGLAAIVVIHGLLLAGLMRTTLGAYLMMLILVVHAGVLIWVFRRHVKAGQGRFTQLLGAGMVISLLAGLVAGAGSMLYTEVSDPGYLSWLREESTLRLQQSPLSAVEKESRRVRIVESVRQPQYALQTVIGSMVSGLLLSFLLAVILRQRGDG